MFRDNGPDGGGFDSGTGTAHQEAVWPYYLIWGISMPFAYWSILIAAVLPLIIIGYAKAGSRDNSAPRDSAENLSGAKRRAYAAHQNAFESFPFYAVSVIAALNFGASATTVSVLAALYLAFRIAHALLYIADKSSLRSTAYAGGLFANIAIFLSPALKINFF
ncbi:MAPEG family protein [Tardiphaga robiniae]|nr:MAPEG family protein [Tardiphaga robiniae]